MTSSSMFKSGFRAKLATILTGILMVVGVAPAYAADVAFTSFGSVSVSGSGTVGNILTASTTSWTPAATSVAIQWKRDGNDIAGANSSSYTLVGDDYGSYITASATATKAGYVTNTVNSATYNYVYVSGKANLTNTPAPVVSGTLQVGEYVFADTSGWDSGVTFTYQWYASGFRIYDATSSSYQLQASDKNDRMSVTVTGTKNGYYSQTSTSVSSDYVKPAVPKVSWTSNYGQLTGKNNLVAKADFAYGSTSQIRTWCLTRDSAAIDVPAGAKGVYFVDASGISITPSAIGGGCYASAYSNLQNLRLRVDVTNWGVGSHVIYATAKDAEGMVSANTVLSVYVAKTAPTVTGNFATIPAVVADNFSFSASTTTHSVTAPVSEWCISVDGQRIPDGGQPEFKTTANGAQAAVFTKTGSSAGCYIISGSGDMGQGTLTLDSKMFANGTHEMTVEVLSWDGETSWWSDPIKTSFKTKNKYIPTVTWNASNAIVAIKGSPNKLGGMISANIPGSPSLVTLSTLGSGGTVTKFFDVANANIFTAAPVLSKNTTIQIEIFDEDNLSVLKETTELHVAPLVKLAKPKISLTVSTLSTAVTKTVTVNVSSSKGQAASCTAKWSGGSKGFRITNGVGKFFFVPRGAGTVSVGCNASGMSASKAVLVRY